METTRTFITAKLSIFAIINLRGVSTNKKSYIFYRHAIIQRTYNISYVFRIGEEVRE